MFSNTFAGIAPSSAPVFIAAQVVGAGVAIAVIRTLYPDVTPAEASDIVFPHHEESQAAGPGSEAAPISGGTGRSETNDKATTETQAAVDTDHPGSPPVVA
jgi:hypothetical protein